MNSEGFFFQAFIYLLAAVASVPIAKRLGLGSVLGYLIAGVLIGPHALRLVGNTGNDVRHVAEFGVVMMLFLVGLELRPNLLWKLRGPILGAGGLQLLATTIVFAGLSMWAGLPPGVAVAIGMIFSASSTAIALQSLTERGQLATRGGQASFSVLLFQDLSVIPILAILPLLVAHSAGTTGAESTGSVTGPWLRALIIIEVVAAIVLGLSGEADFPLYRPHPAPSDLQRGRAVTRCRDRTGHGTGRSLSGSGDILSRRRVGRE
jgi:Kef-type K+ transport system membrane component KefB